MYVACGPLCFLFTPANISIVLLPIVILYYMNHFKAILWSLVKYMLQDKRSRAATYSGQKLQMRAVQRREKKSCRWVWRKCNSGIELQGHPKKTKKKYISSTHAWQAYVINVCKRSRKLRKKIDWKTKRSDPTLWSKRFSRVSHLIMVR